MLSFPRALLFTAVLACAQAPAQVKDLKITLLSTNLAERGIGEWGFSALVEAGGRRILFDTGAQPETVLSNAQALGIDLSTATELVISHHHGDHTGGLERLRGALKARSPEALRKLYAGRGMFFERPSAGGRDGNSMNRLGPAIRASGGEIVEVAEPLPLAPGLWLTGPVTRVHDEKNWSGAGRLRLPSGELAEDTVPEDMSMVFETARGLVVLTGCAHAGVVNIAEFARKIGKNSRIHAMLGGLHLMSASDPQLQWTAGRLKDAGLQLLMGTHCTGVESLYRLREAMGGRRGEVVVGATGATFTLAGGLSPGVLSR